MGIFDFLHRQDPGTNARLVGCWHLVRIDGVDAPDFVELDIRPDGELFSSIMSKTEHVWKVGRLTYQLEGSDVIVIDLVRTGFVFEPDGTLRLDSLDNSAWYERGPKKAPEP